MVIAKTSTCDAATVTWFIQSRVAGARLSSDVSTELTYILPHNSKASFCQLFLELDKNREALGIVSYGASITTMDEVFIRLSLHGRSVVKVKVADTRLLSVGFWSQSRFLAVSLQVMRVINSPVGCYYFPPGLQLPPQPLRGLLPISLLGEQRV